jgi:hypothetical protein
VLQSFAVFMYRHISVLQSVLGRNTHGHYLTDFLSLPCIQGHYSTAIFVSAVYIEVIIELLSVLLRSVQSY